jgi:hypothetical protein
LVKSNVNILITGTFKSAGGTGGSGGENGGPGTIYVHKLPVENEDLSKFVSNRTLVIDNHNRAPNDSQSQDNLKE